MLLPQPMPLSGLALLWAAGWFFFLLLLGEVGADWGCCPSTSNVCAIAATDKNKEQKIRRTVFVFTGTTHRHVESVRELGL